MVFIDETAHVRQLFFDLKVALLEELRLEVGEDGQAGLECEDFAVKYHIVPDAASNLEINVLDKDCDEPVCQEEGCVDLERLKMRMQFGQYLSEVAVEKFDSQLDILDVASEECNEQLLVDEVREADEGGGLFAINEECARQETQILRNKLNEEELEECCKKRNVMERMMEWSG